MWFIYSFIFYLFIYLFFIFIFIFFGGVGVKSEIFHIWQNAVK